MTNQGHKVSDTMLFPTVDSLNRIKVIDDIPYREGESESWKLDLASPVNFGEKPMPAIVIIHGGGWRSGSKQVNVYRSMLIDFAFQGYVAISVEYRFTDEAPFPACIEDVKCAVRWLRAHAKELNVNTDRIGAFGHSAGAHLAVMLAVSSENKNLEGDGGWNGYSSKINAVVGGSTPVQLDRERAGNWDNTEYWPVGYISANVVPMLIIHGSGDKTVNVASVDKYVENLKASGASDVTYLRIEGGNHGVAYDESLDVTNPAIDKFFARTLKGE